MRRRRQPVSGRAGFGLFETCPRAGGDTVPGRETANAKRMNWYFDITWWEYGLAGLFVFFYGAYVVRVWRKARQMGSRPSGLAAKALLRLLYLGLIIIGLLGPTFGSIRKEVKAVGRDIYLVVDLSQSMDATDIAPSRLERVKYELVRWIADFPSDRIGLIVFSNEAFVQCPLTYDQNALRLFIETLRTDMLPQGGTNLGAALRLALQRNSDGKNTSARNQARIVVLVTDGEDFGGQAQQAAEALEQNGLRLFVLGVGTQAGGRIPVANGHKRGKDGRTVVTKLQPEALRQLARSARGEYFELSRLQNETGRLNAATAKVEGQVQDTRKMDVSANKFYYFLIAALVLLLMDIMVAVTTIHL